jgi:hypothetical protein
MLAKPPKRSVQKIVVICPYLAHVIDRIPQVRNDPSGRKTKTGGRNRFPEGPLLHIASGWVEIDDLRRDRAVAQPIKSNTYPETPVI